MPPSENNSRPAILLTGGSGYVGGRLIPMLEQLGVPLRCLARTPDKLRPRCEPSTEIVSATCSSRFPGRRIPGHAHGLLPCSPDVRLEGL